MNKSVFTSKTAVVVPPADMLNEAGGKAYSLTDAASLAQLAMTGTFTDTFYATAEDQTAKVLELAKKVDAEFLAKLAMYSRKRGFMKDMPAVLTAVLLARNEAKLFKKVFPIAIDDFKMLKNFVQVVRSGVTGRKSLGSMARNAVRNFLEGATDSELFAGSIGNEPSLADVIKMVHPKPANVKRANMYAYLLGKKFDVKKLPEEVRAFEAFKTDPTGTPPEVNFQFLSSVKMDAKQWSALSETMSWHTLRMNLNTLERNGVLADKKAVDAIAAKLADPKTIKALKVFPYQIMSAFVNATTTNSRIKNALQDAMEAATENVPEFGETAVCVDVSGSMSSPITGSRPGATSAVRCIDVASLIASAVLRKNPNSIVVPFEDRTREIDLNPRDSVMTNAQKLARLGGGGTACSAALAKLNADKAKLDLVFYVSDNMSWADFSGSNSWYGASRTGTNMASEWAAFKKRNPKAKLVLLDIQPYANTQVQTSKDVLNIGGFSDKVFDVVAQFAKGETTGDHWVDVINAVSLSNRKSKE
jgi:60 kDa SS-A/Ro ribonucleoprotein